MTHTTDNDVDKMGGTLPIFAQPHFVLFPGTSQIIAVTTEPLRQLVADVLRDQGLLAVSLCSAVDDFVCVARIVTPMFFSPAANCIHIQGVCRAQINSRHPADDLSQRATITARPDHYAMTPVIDRHRRHEELLAAFRELFPHILRNDLFQLWAGDQLTLGELCDQLADQLPLAPSHKQSMLAEPNVDLRSDLLLAQLRELLRGQREATIEQSANPQFSVN
ncbi:ATP-dependent protease La (LON) domain protein [Symmachiella macrocystis]|uniref:ATP-dependent protease La (LON) domain protein n=1 Tax=Symmachiella macrocystis TaxID=2527985 RepID=A0A5C6BL48_9PLAN|nr:LON peptidase substrate-binding domain-containing protein [Symmachiella macrocystis]TWU12377.1 ATP-dependent protease La (LON) domain protein [Symmachiella macrocystis]